MHRAVKFIWPLFWPQFIYSSSHACPQEAPSFPKEKFCPASGQNPLGEGRNADITKFSIEEKNQ
jgi:hypothetical protein